ncbi:PREDICTED: uncharacterized protein LOC108578262, partial [Habropoda laboriosa]|uniref:uncharacterized protein LOC108578262 n=1 Tax=Habropoda laboriosa TaxID=597456 RepID=UPI00083CE432
MNADALERKVKAYEDLHAKFDSIQSKIEILVTGSDSETQHLDERDAFEDVFFPLIAQAETLIANLRGPRELTASTSTVPTAAMEPQGAPRLPIITLPSFDGKYDHWVRFRDTFSTMVHNNKSLTDIQRFHYLTSALKGAAARTIETLAVSDTNYKLAWANLKRRFEDPDSLIHHHVNSLLEIPNIAAQTSSSLREFIDKANNQLVALGALGEPIEAWDTLMIIMLAKKLDSKTFEAWDMRATNAIRKQKFNDFVEFIEQQAKRLERAATNPQTIAQVSEQAKKGRAHRFQGRSETVAAHASSTRNQCALCKGEHLLQQCGQLKALPALERHETIKRLRLCFNCLQQGHSIKNCTRGMCRKCGKKHHTLLHREEPAQEIASVDSSDSPIPSCVSNSVSTAIEYTVLSTAIVYVEDRNGKRHECRALLDVGSQEHFVTEELSNKLGFSRSPIKTVVGGLGRASKTIQYKSDVVIHSRDNKFRTNLSCLVIKDITDDMPNLPTNFLKICVPPNITLADPQFNKKSRIDLLIGAGLFWKLLCIGQQRVDSSDLVWQKTRLGWVLGGSVISLISPHPTNRSTCHSVMTTDLNRTISQFWEIEEVQPSSIETSGSSTDPSETHFDLTTTRDETGRYIVKIPFNSKLGELGQSRTQAKNRLLGMERRFSKNLELNRLYTEFMTEYNTLGHMTQLTDQKVICTEPNFYLPHHAVFKQSSTTKIRVVFDGSAKGSSGVSLNDAQLVGPTVQSDLFSILIRFRKHRFVLSADIEKMYRQILVHPEHRNFQRILWRPSGNAPIKVYQLNTVTYGTASASFLATRVLKQIGLDHAHAFPAASRAIVNDFYVDDLLTGCETISNAIKIRKDLTEILARAGFSLRKWASNDSETLGSQHPHQESIEIRAADQDPKTLGLLWMTRTDDLRYSIGKQSSGRTTKRTVLSEIAQIFDPLGLIGSIVTKAKLFMQSLWQLKINWDETLPQDLHTQWSAFREELQTISSISISRHVISHDSDRIELHAFSDASEKAYGSCVYLRTVDKAGASTARLLCAKSRVAPLRSTTLPRLELCGALLASQLTSKAKGALQMSITDEFYWSDSTIVLAWLKSPPSKWTKYVANRVSEIQQLTARGVWNHVSSNDNPADIISRGANTKSLTNCELWWFGPYWLAQKAVNGLRYNLPLKIYLRFRRKVGQESLTHPASQANPLNPRYLTTRELIDAEIALVKLAQRDQFNLEVDALIKKRSLNPRSVLRALSPFLDNAGVIRVGGRLDNAPIAYEHKHPMILPAKHPLTKLIVEHEHRRLLHSGHQLTLASLRARFWPITGKQVVKKKYYISASSALEFAQQ